MGLQKTPPPGSFVVWLHRAPTSLVAPGARIVDEVLGQALGQAYGYRWAYLKALAYIEAQLREPPAGQENFWTQAFTARAHIAKARIAMDVSGAAAAAAAYGGLIKRWRRFVVDQLTVAALAGQDTSRLSVRAWQQRVFARSVASGRLSTFSTPARSGGGRMASPPQVPEHVELAAATIYGWAKYLLKDLSITLDIG